jgi:cytochrome c556
MKKLIIGIISIACVFGCGKKKVEEIGSKVVSAEREQAVGATGDDHSFIKDEQGFIVHMKDIKVLLKHLSMSINTQDWEAIKHDTKKLKKASPVAFTGANKKSLPVEFINLDVKFHLSALELIGASQKKDKDKATAAFFNVVNSCDECHAKFNPKESSTSWFQ